MYVSDSMYINEEWWRARPYDGRGLLRYATWRTPPVSCLSRPFTRETPRQYLCHLPPAA
ncbi:hypothetical protein ACFYPX_11000 [Micromonospora zamorensis]|uniref:hypothetical protein n=1 Tax=Micromonospora zamorensis TaxID=709883 RepID=UPI00369E5831